mgnify:CR=1 FL=1
MNTLHIEGHNSEVRFDKLGNGEIMVEVRTPMAIIVHTIHPEDALNLLVWLSEATS